MTANVMPTPAAPAAAAQSSTPDKGIPSLCFSAGTATGASSGSEEGCPASEGFSGSDPSEDAEGAVLEDGSGAVSEGALDDTAGGTEEAGEVGEDATGFPGSVGGAGAAEEGSAGFSCLVVAVDGKETLSALQGGKT